MGQKEKSTKRVGVFVCDCGSNINGVVNCADLADYAGTLPHVVLAKRQTYTCAQPGQEVIQKQIKEANLTHVVIACCSPRIHQETFRKVVAEAGLNPYCLEIANIREQCSWVTVDKKEATEKAKAIVRVAVGGVVFNQPLEASEIPVNPQVLVVGGGIAGIQSALDLAESGAKVFLVEKEPSLGGHMAQLDKTFPTLDCSACILTPKMVEAAKHPNIELLTYSEVEEVSGYVGNFKIKVRKKARFIDEDKCIGCHDCLGVCPVYRLDGYREFEKKEGKIPLQNLTLGNPQAIYIPFMQAVPNVPTIDKDFCLFFKNNPEKKDKCMLCARNCSKDAIDHRMEDEMVELEVGNIILATGYQEFDPTRIKRYGYGRFDNVISSLDFEKLINASGITGGKILTADRK